MKTAQYLAFLALLGVILFAGCSPKYAHVTEYRKPDDEEGKACIREAELFKIKCERDSNALYSECISHAKLTAQTPHMKAVEHYNSLLSEYQECVDKWENSTPYKKLSGSEKISYSIKVGMNRAANGATHDVYSNCLNPGRQPRLQDYMDVSTCQKDVSCVQEYAVLFEGCGGQIKRYERCIAHCD